MANFKPKIIYGSGPTTITLTLPPQGDHLNELLRGDVIVTRANDGTEQVQYNHYETIYTVNLTFLTSAQETALRTFFTSHAVKGNTFRYFPSEDEATEFTMSLADYNYAPSRIVADGSGDFLYELTLSMRLATV